MQGNLSLWGIILWVKSWNKGMHLLQNLEQKLAFFYQVGLVCAGYFSCVIQQCRLPQRWTFLFHFPPPPLPKLLLLLLFTVEVIFGKQFCSFSASEGLLKLSIASRLSSSFSFFPAGCSTRKWPSKFLCTILPPFYDSTRSIVCYEPSWLPRTI